MGDSTLLNAEAVARALHGTFCRGASRHQLLQLAATKIRETGPPYTGVYIYILDEEALRLEAYDGPPPPLSSLPVSEGMHGKAIADRMDVNTPDVSTSDGQVTCAPSTRSHLIILIRRHDQILGEIAVESDRDAGFDGADEAAVKGVADALAALL